MWRNMLDQLEKALDDVFAELFPSDPDPKQANGRGVVVASAPPAVSPASVVAPTAVEPPLPAPVPLQAAPRVEAPAPVATAAPPKPGNRWLSVTLRTVPSKEPIKDEVDAPMPTPAPVGQVNRVITRTGAPPPDSLLRRLNWTILRPLARYLGGEERSLVRGPGMEVSEIREYQPGDDVRHIDWSVTARSDRPYVREAFVERALDAWLILDVSGSVDWGTAQCLKRDRAVEFAAVAGQLLGRNGNRVGAVMFADKPLNIVPPGVGRVHLLGLLSHLRETPRQAEPAPTDLAAALTRAYTVIRRKSLILVVSDFLVEPGWQRALGQLAQRHEVVAVRLSDPREGEIPDIGWVTFEDPETGLQLTVDTGDRKLRERFQKAAEAQSAQIRADLVSCGIDELPLSTGSDLLPTLISFLNARKFKRGARSGAGTTNLSALHGES